MDHIALKDYDAVAFDIEGTLADTLSTHHAARLETFAQHGFGHITRQQHELGPIYGSSAHDIVGGILHAAGEIDKQVPFTQNPVVQDIVTSRIRVFERLAVKGFEEMPGAVNFVLLMAKIYPRRMALVTSSSERFILPFIQSNHLIEHFSPDLIITEETTIAQGLEGKPAPDPYLLAMRRLRAKRLLVFEDTVSGVESARRAGATVIALGFDPNNTKLFESGQLSYPPHTLVSNYAEAQKLLRLPD